MTAVGKMNKPVLRRRIAGEVARDVAGAALGGARSFDVMVDESGARPQVTITIEGSRDGALEERVKTAFRTYEFNTTIAFAG